MDHGATERKREPGQSGIVQRARQKESYMFAADPGRTNDEVLSGLLAEKHHSKSTHKCVAGSKVLRFLGANPAFERRIAQNITDFIDIIPESCVSLGHEPIHLEGRTIQYIILKCAWGE